MATIRFFMGAKDRELAPIYVNVSAGRAHPRIIENTRFSFDPKNWSNDTQTIRQRIDISETDEEILNRLDELRALIKKELKLSYADVNKGWLAACIDRFHNKQPKSAKTLNDYIETFIKKGEKGEIKKRKSGMNIAIGTVKIFKGFQKKFNEFQGIYTEQRIKELKEANKPLRPIRRIDFDDINEEFYNSFVAFLENEGLKQNTVGRFIHDLKILMSRALKDKKHNNRDFQDFRVFREPADTIYLTDEELEKIYNLDLSSEPRKELARDKFMFLCEVAQRVSDYPQIEKGFKTIKGGPVIEFTRQKKTGRKAIVPATTRFLELWHKYEGKLPQLPEQKVNYLIKDIAKECGINEECSIRVVKRGLSVDVPKKKHELITCHTARRSGATNMLNAGLTVEEIRRILGHSTEKQTREYLKLDEEEAAIEISKHEYFHRPNLKKVK